jgi:2-polyprenyl-3-methyl-5-hydroxy-6-metoxy-1,4-benzoquinol methylase
VDPWKGQLNAHSEVYWCDDCAHGSLQPLPSPGDVAEFYNFQGYYTHLAPSERAEYEAQRAGRSVGKLQALLDRVRVHVAYRVDRGSPLTEAHVHRVLGRRAASICDLGCGDGDLALALSRLGYQVVGVEVDPEAASQRVRGDCEVLRGSAEELPAALEGRQFDCVIMRHVLEHCRQPRQVLENARGLLRPGGVLMCEVPNNEALGLSLLGSAWAMFDVPRHLHFFSGKSLVRTCVAAGFRVEAPYYANFHRQFDNAWINDERKLFTRLMGEASKPQPAPMRNSRWRSWALLLATLCLPARRKYDSVGVIAVPRD